MQENSKYFEKTAEALQNMHASISELERAANAQIQNNTLLNAKTMELRQEIATEASRIDDLIKTLSGALQ